MMNINSLFSTIYISEIVTLHNFGLIVFVIQKESLYAINAVKIGYFMPISLKDKEAQRIEIPSE